MKRPVIILAAITVLVAGVAIAQVAVKDDPLVRMPGSQPAPEGSVGLEAPNRCLNCHGGYNSAVEPAHNWKGSMMAQAGRDFLFFACLTTAAQDAQHVVGSTNATDICLRCHFPKGWLEGRSEPTNGTAMTGADWDGVQCDFCHTNYDPFFETTYAGTREGDDWLNYWDETNASGTPSDSAAADTYAEDALLAQAERMMNGDPFFSNNLPPAAYDENGSGQYFVSTTRDKRASFADAEAKHGMFYSRYHKSKNFCGTCHDVSNPILANHVLGGVPAGATRADIEASGETLWTEDNPAYSFFHVERTFSEFMLSGYGQQGGAPGKGPFAPEVYDTSLPNNYIARCQDCHMRDLVGTGCDKNGAPIRPNDSTEHPNSGQPVHDLTGGNAWVSWVLASAVPGSPNYDSANDSLLNQGASVLTLDLNQGQGIDAVALLDGVDRAKQQLLLAAAITDVNYSASNGALSFRVQNQTGHKLISGFPEGRRMFLNIKAFDAADQLIYEVNPYDGAAGTLKGLGYSYYDPDTTPLPAPDPLGPTEVYVDELVYEAHPSSTLTGEDETFHFALATERYKDNRIPPKGFDVAAAAARLSVPRWHGDPAPGYFTSAEYQGGYDEVSIEIVTGAAYVEVGLYYQTTSREYIQFLRDEINGYPDNPQDMTLPASAYIAQNGGFFSQLAAWGDTIWALWKNNMNVDGAAPFLMAQATVGAPPEPCSLAAPTLDSAVPASNQVTVSWTGVSGATGYSLFYDQQGKSQFRADAGLATSFVDSGLTNDNEYCYKITSYDATCESGYSNIRCATPAAPGQEVYVGVLDPLEVGSYVTTGKGKNRQTVFEPGSSFSQGDAIVVRAHVVDNESGLPLVNATVEVTFAGPETVTLSSITDTNGMVEIQWDTQAPNKRGQGGTATGSYIAATTSVTVAGYTWDGVERSAGFTLN